MKTEEELPAKKIVPLTVSDRMRRNRINSKFVTLRESEGEGKLENSPNRRSTGAAAAILIRLSRPKIGQSAS
jgi:hypothetical protein